MKCYHSFIISTKISPYECLVQLYAVIKHKMINPKIPIILLTDKKSFQIFKSLELVDIYDDVITDIFDDYPYDRISDAFWSSPKIWAISKLPTPFAIIDTDLIYSRPLKEFEHFDFGYLHRETSNVYPRPYEISTPNGFKWESDMLYYFRISTPINAAVLYFNNEIFKNEFTQRYFNFVLDNEGKFVNIAEELLKDSVIVNGILTSYIAPSAAVIFAEQAMLGALVEKYMSTDTIFRSGQALPIIFNSAFFNRFSAEENRKSIQEMINESYYHLWGAKYFINNDECNCKLPKIAEMLIKSGQELLTNGNCWDKYGSIYERYKKQIIQSLQTANNLEDTTK